MSLSKGVYSKDDCVKIKSKDSYHTRRSKKNTYYVTNKNIASSKIPMVVRRKRGCHSGASPSLVGSSFLDNRLGCRGIRKLRLLVVIGFYIGVPWASPSVGSCHSLFQNPYNLYPKTWNFTTQNWTENLMSSVSIRKQTTTLRYCNEFILYLCWY